eukprot:gene3964-7220_t
MSFNFPILAGYIATFCFTLCYLPQAILNFQRKSVSGFSTTGIVIKLIGASFLGVNAYILGETVPTVLYGGFNILQHSIFMWQFATYTKNQQFYLWITFPLFALFLGQYLPATMFFTNSIKPIAQIFSHLPQLYVTYEKKSTVGVSMMSQHLNLIGGFLGLYMCYEIPPKSITTYMIYLFSLFQAVSLYAFAIYYDGFERFYKEIKEEKKDINTNKDLEDVE